MRQVDCPSCGAQVRFASAVALLAVCAYCRATLLRRDLDVEQIGTMALLIADPSPLQLGSDGWFEGTHFALVGRLQVTYPGGAWNEWFLSFDDQRAGWLGEAGGTYTVSFETAVTGDLPSWDDLRPGLEITLDGTVYEVADVRVAQIVGAEGELPFVVEGGSETRVADCRTPTARFATLDYGDDPPRVFLGTVVEFAALRLGRLRTFPGWDR
jgi:hypothetical protein